MMTKNQRQNGIKPNLNKKQTYTPQQMEVSLQ